MIKGISLSHQKHIKQANVITIANNKSGLLLGDCKKRLESIFNH